MFLSSITFTQHHSLFLGFAICRYIVYKVTKRMIYTYTYYLRHATSLPNGRQHHLPNLDVLPQRPTLSSTSSIVRTLHPFNTRVPGAVSMEVEMSFRPWCSSDLPYYKLCILGLLSTFDDTLELRGSLRKIIFHPFFLVIYKKTITAYEGKMQMNLLNKGSINQIWRVWINCTCIWYLKNYKAI